MHQHRHDGAEYRRIELITGASRRRRWTAAEKAVEVDNNTVERGIRPIPLGRKNALFAGSHSGGERWAILASLINTAKLHGLDPQTYLADVLDRIVPGRTCQATG